MTSSFVDKVKSLTVATGQTASNSLAANEWYGDAAALGIISPATLDAGTYKWQVSVDDTNWFDLVTGNPLADELIPAISEAAVYYGVVVWPYIRISGPSAAADRVFLVVKHWTGP